MTSYQQLFFGLIIILTLIACKNQTKGKEQTVEDKIAEITKTDSATETTMLNPNFEESKIRGFGIFKIGKSFDSTISYLISTKAYKIDSFANSEQKMKFDVKHLLDKAKFIIKINHPKSTLDNFDELENASWCKETKNYWVTKYSIDNINFNNIYVTYYKDNLVYISCDWSLELNNAIESKFGKADENISDINQTPTYSSTHWFNKDIKAGYTSFSGLKFEFEIKGGYKFLYGCSSRDFEAQDKIDKANKKAQLKNF